MDERRNTARQALASVPVNAMFAQAALDLGAPLWSDREVDARAFHVVHPYGMSFVWAPADDEAFPLVVSHLAGRARRGVAPGRAAMDGLGWDDAWGAACASSPGGSGVTMARHTRVNFAFDESANAVRRGVRPAGWVGRSTGHRRGLRLAGVGRAESFLVRCRVVPRAGRRRRARAWRRGRCDGFRFVPSGESGRAGDRDRATVATAGIRGRRCSGDDRRGTRCRPRSRVVLPGGQRRLVPPRQRARLHADHTDAVLPPVASGRDGLTF